MGWRFFDAGLADMEQKKTRLRESGLSTVHVQKFVKLL
jgi:hypothetical protein